MTDIVARANAALEGTTPGPWAHCTAPHGYDGSLPVATADKADWQTETLIGDGEPLHVLTAASTEPRFAYIVPAITGDGPTSGPNAEFIAAARSLVPELVAEIEHRRSTEQRVRAVVDQLMSEHGQSWNAISGRRVLNALDATSEQSR